MKKVFLFLSVIGISLLTTSCLKGGDAAFSGQFISYVTLDNTSKKVYAKVFDNQGLCRFVTSPELQKEPAGYFALLGCSWKEEYGMASEMGNSVYNVHTLGEIDKKPFVDFSFSDNLALNGANPPSFELFKLLYDASKVKDNFFEDNWLFSFRCELKKEEKATLRFNFDSKKQDSKEKDNVIIDVILEKSGTPTTTTDSQWQGYAAVRFSQLRKHLLAQQDVKYSDVVMLKFRYQKEKGATKPYVSEGIKWALRDTGK